MTFKEENLKTKTEIADKAVSGDKMEEWAFHNLGRFKCVHCGEYVSPAVVKYFDYRVDRVECYECQKHNVGLTKSINECEEAIKEVNETEEKTEELIDEPTDELYFARKEAEKNRKNFNPEQELSEKDQIRLGIKDSICVHCGEKATTINQAGEPSCEEDSWIGN